MRMKSKSALDRLEGSAQAQLPAEDRDQLDLRSGQVDGGGHDEQVPEGGGLDDVLDRDVVKDDVVNRGVEIAGVDPESGRGVALGVEVDDEDPIAEFGERRAQVHGGGRLSDAPF